MNLITDIKVTCESCSTPVPIEISETWFKQGGHTVKQLAVLYSKHECDATGRWKRMTCPLSGHTVKDFCAHCKMRVSLSPDGIAIAHITGVSIDLCPGSGRAIYDFAAEQALMEMMK